MRHTQIPRTERSCGMGGKLGACCMPINALLSSWDQRAQCWRPELRCCHLHAMEAITGKPVMEETFEDKERVMRELCA